MRAPLTSLGRSEATAASVKTLIDDTASAGGATSRETVRRHIARLVEAFVIEPLAAWATHLRSKATLRVKPKRCFADPSLAAAAIGATPHGLYDNLETLGLLFESLAIRDPRSARLRAGLQSRDPLLPGQRRPRSRRNHHPWTSRLGGGGDQARRPGAHQEGRQVAALAARQRRHQAPRRPRRLMVITASGHAYETTDGIAIVPLDQLAP
ncbi:DUF4143 domain-containing protein [Candidatus Poriferisodalis sp.]|uniref:DUF4143 domain-containing protein n=1 Tax=Candidatus Poriferisodalis sp. TaxID=3101277 RepID=UPI003B019144